MSLVYVYAIAHAGNAPPPGLRGLADRPVRAERDGMLVAFVSDVPEEDFAEVPLNRNLSDLDWLSPRAVVHQEVNAALAAAVDPLVPLSFGTVFLDGAGVARMLRDRTSQIGPRLDALRGKAEWIAVVRRDAAAVLAGLETSSEALRALRATIDASAPGRAYLVARGLDAAKRQELRASDAAAVASATAALEAAGGRLFREPLVDDPEAGMIARYSVLADRGAGAALARASLGDGGASGYSLELSGPWPAYRFATVDPA